MQLQVHPVYVKQFCFHLIFPFFHLIDMLLQAIVTIYKLQNESYCFSFYRCVAEFLKRPDCQLLREKKEEEGHKLSGDEQPRCIMIGSPQQLFQAKATLQ